MFYLFLTKNYILRTSQLTLVVNDLKKALKLKKFKIKKKNKNILFTPLKLSRTYLIYNKLTNVTRYIKHRLNSITEFNKLPKIKFYYITSIFPEKIFYKKTLGSRMGKGRGTLKFFYFYIVKMESILTLININYKLCCYLFQRLKKKYLPLVYYRYLVFKTNLSWLNRFMFWQIFFCNLLFDDLFSYFIKSIYLKLFILPGFFILDKIISPWMGTFLFKKIFKWTSFNFFFENQYILTIWLTLIYGWLFIIIFLSLNIF